ncbi:MAG: hypothetical protein EON58_07515 [Alphaproteobacteria bacterium]|nr:MAG: hypothetical protein EON58_07515 [Alphaproteobacteria bacterium]
MKIEISRGLDGLLLGMTEQQLTHALGPPDKVIVTEFENRDLCYYRLQTVFKIEPANDNRLGWVSVYDRTTTLSDLYPWEVPKEHLLATLGATLGEPFEVSDYGEMESYYFPKHVLELQYRLGRLDAINFGVPYGFDDQPLWPSLPH